MFFHCLATQRKLLLMKDIHKQTRCTRNNRGGGGGGGSIFLKIYANKYTESYFLKLLTSLCTFTCVIVTEIVYIQIELIKLRSAPFLGRGADVNILRLQCNLQL